MLVPRILSRHADALHVMDVSCSDAAGVVRKLQRQDEDVSRPEGDV